MRKLLLLAFLPCISQAAIIVAASCSSANVGSAITSASTGDTVQVTGTCNWSGATVTVPSTKGITVDGQGTTTITGSGHLAISQGASSSRITGFTFTGTWPCCGDHALSASGSPSSAPARIDHNTVNGGTSTGGQTAIQVDGNSTVLIDNNNLLMPDNSEIIHNFGLGPGVTTGWTDNVTPGSGSMVYIETNTITNNSGGSSFFGNSAVQSYYCARTVFRNNTVFFSQVDQHGTPGNVGARWWEVYNNQFQIPSSGGNQSNYMQIRAGSGVVFGNTKTGGSNSGGGLIEFVEEDTGTWPLAFQIGSGINGQTNQHSTCAGGTLNQSPAYVWGNSSSMNVTSGGTVSLNRDYFSSANQPATLLRQQLSTDTCSTTYSYAPFTYPYPLTAGGMPNPSGAVTAPSVTTTVASSITTTSAASGGTVISNGGASVTSEGVCYATSANPTTPCTSDGISTPFVSSLSGLSSGILYHYRAFATNSAGTSYGTDLTFTTLAPNVSLNPTSFTFSSQGINTTSPANSTTLTNTGTSTLNISSIVIVGTNSPDYTISSNTCGATVAVNGTCSVSVTFTPSATGSRVATLQFTTDDPGSPDNLTITGTGVNIAQTKGVVVFGGTGFPGVK